MSDHVKVVVEGDADDLRRALRTAAADLKLFGAEAERQSRSTDRLSSSIDRTDRGFLDLGRTVSRTNSHFSLLRNTFSALKLPAMLGAAGAGAEGLTALAGGAVSLTSALAPLSGALVGYPALLGGLGQAAGVVALAGVDDLTEALGGNEEALKRLNPEGRQLVRTLEDLEPRYRRLQTSAQKPLFAGITEGVDEAMANFPALNAVVGDTSRELGDLIAQGGRFVGREGFGADFRTVASGNVELIDHLGQAGFNFADALRHVMVEAQPLLSWMGRGVESFSEFAEAEAKAGRQSGDLAAFFGETRQAMHRVVDIGGSLFNVLMDIGAASKPFGEDYLVTIRNAADAMERFTGSVEGQEALGNFFAESDRKLREMAETIEDILDEGSLADSISRAIELAVPEIAEHAGELGVAIAEGLIKGFANADLAGKIFSAAAFIRLVGGSGALWKVGAAIGSKIGLGILGPLGLGIAAGQIIDSLFPRKLDDMVDDVVDAVVKRFEDMKTDLAPVMQRIGLNAMQMGDGLRITRSDFRAAAEGAEFFSDSLTEGIDHIKAFERAVRKNMDEVSDSVKDTGKDIVDFATGSGKSFRAVDDRSSKMEDGVSDNVRGLADAVTTGLGLIVGNTNEALEGFGVKKVAISLKDVGKSVGGVLGKQRGGHINEGAPSGDTVPALLERDEYVLNRNAVRTIGKRTLDAINFGAAARFQAGGPVRRMATGGGLDFALGPYTIPPIQYDANHAGGNSHVHITGTTTPWVVAIGKRLQQMGFMVGEHPAFGGVNAQHSATGGHYDALAIDVNSAADETRTEVAQIARLLSGAGGGAIAQKIKRLMLDGPKGPLRDMGQGALDKAWKAANAYISKQAPKVTGGSNISAGGIFDKGELMKLWTAVNGGLGDPNVMAALALSESAGDPRAVGNDPGGTQGLGLWQITTGFNDDIIAKYGGRNAMFNPPTNAKAAADILRRQGIGAWYGDYQQFLQRGGIARLARGGDGKGHSMDFNVASGLGVPITEARKIARKLRNLTGGGGSIAKLDERLQIAQTLADADGILSESEAARQLRLQRSLLGDLRGADKLSKAGYRWASKAGGPGRNLRSLFRETQLEMEGVTGRGGRIFDTRRAIAGLHGSDTGPDLSELNAGLAEQLRISQLTSALSQSQYSTFSGFFNEFKAQMPFVGSFAHGTARVPRTGFARVHRDEVILPDPKGPYVNTLTPAQAPTEVTVYVDGDAGPVIKRIRAEIDGRAAKVANRQMGRRARQLAVAPGR